MSEQTVAAAPAPLDPAELVHNAPSMEAMLTGRQRVLDELTARNIDPVTVLLAGYNPNNPKDATTEHFDPGTGKFDFSFGTVESMDLPTAADDPELAAEKVLVNPLHYALQDGNRMGIYDRSKMPGKIEVDEELPSNVGVVASSQAEIDSAKLLDIDFAAPADQAVELAPNMIDTVPRSQLLKEMAGDVALDGSGVSEVAEAAPEKPEEPVQPTLAEAFTDGSSIERVLHDPQTSPDMQRSIRGLVTAYQDAKSAGIVEQAWTEVIAPQLRGLNEALPRTKVEVDNLAEGVNTMAQNLGMFGHALAEGDREHAVEIAQRAGFRTNGEALSNLIRIIGGETSLQQAAIMLTNGESESSDLVRRAVDPDRSLSPEEFDDLSAKVRPLAEQGADETAIKASLMSEVPEDVAGSWRRKQSAIQELSNFARVSGFQTADIEESFAHIMNDLQGFIETVQHGRYDPAHAIELSGRLQIMYHDKIEQAQRMLMITTSLAEGIPR